MWTSPAAAVAKEQRAPASDGLLKAPKGDENQKWWSIGRGRKDSKGKEKEKDTGDGEGPLVGNLIGEDHVNYVLMYNMLTGIRIGVRGAPFILVLDAHSTDRYPAVRPR